MNFTCPMIKSNESKTDRMIRMGLGIILAVLGFISTGAIATVFVILALVLIFTALSGFCPLYRILGISTFKKS